jgi:hypothetical protein
MQRRAWKKGKTTEQKYIPALEREGNEGAHLARRALCGPGEARPHRMGSGEPSLLAPFSPSSTYNGGTRRLPHRGYRIDPASSRHRPSNTDPTSRSTLERGNISLSDEVCIEGRALHSLHITDGPVILAPRPRRQHRALIEPSSTVDRRAPRVGRREVSDNEHRAPIGACTSTPLSCTPPSFAPHLHIAGLSSSVQRPSHLTQPPHIPVHATPHTHTRRVD